MTYYNTFVPICIHWCSIQFGLMGANIDSLANFPRASNGAGLCAEVCVRELQGNTMLRRSTMGAALQLTKYGIRKGIRKQNSCTTIFSSNIAFGIGCINPLMLTEAENSLINFCGILKVKNKVRKGRLLSR